jgi:peptidyl-prolyl cis-trans isomerase B (cyclophilin B)
MKGNVKQMKENIGKYLLLTLLGLIALIILIGVYPFAIYVLSDKEKELSDEIPYFNVTVKLKYISSWDNIEGYFSNDGEVAYIISFDGKTDIYDYDNYNTDEGLILNFKDEDGFEVHMIDRTFGGMTRILEDDEIIGFRILGTLPSWELDFSDFKRIDLLDISWKCDFPQKKTWSEDGDKSNGDLVRMETSFGVILIDLYEEETPLHAANFKSLAENGSLEGIYFHRVIPGFVVQGGDPLTRDNQDKGDDGTGGIGERIPAEIGKLHLRGTLGAARTGQGNPEKLSSGSQFYFCLDRLSQLDGKYTVFGEVVKGMEVIDEIAKLERDPNDNPLESVVILKTSLVF